MGTGILKPGDKALDFTLVEAASGQLLGPADFAGKQSGLNRNQKAKKELQGNGRTSQD